MKITLITFTAAFAVLFVKNFFGQELPAGVIWELSASNHQISRYVAEAVGGALVIALAAWFFTRLNNKAKA